MSTGYSDVPSPGGYLKLYGVRIAKALFIGGVGAGLAVGAGVAVTHFGTTNSGQVEHFCEGGLAYAASGGIALSCRNPFQGTGAILASDEQGIFINENPVEAAHLWAGVANNATASGSEVFSKVGFGGAKRFVSTAFSGSTLRTSGIVLVGSGKYLNFKWSYGTDGSTTSGKDAGFARLKWFNCSDISSNGRC